MYWSTFYQISLFDYNLKLICISMGICNSKSKPIRNYNPKE